METRTMKLWSCWVLLLSAVGLGACGGGELGKGGARYAKTASDPSAGYAPSAKASQAPAADYAAPSAAPPAPATESSREEAPATTDARSRYSRANVQLSEARRELDIATSQRDCANACRALDSMERAASQLCELAQSNDEKRTCKSAQDQVGAARDRVHSACGDCPKKPR